MLNTVIGVIAEKRPLLYIGLPGFVSLRLLLYIIYCITSTYKFNLGCRFNFYLC